MKPEEQPAAAAANSPEPPDAGGTNATGLPWFRTWRAVYLFVLGCFVVDVVLLAILSRAFS